MIGAVIGDISGSRYEFSNYRSKDVPILDGFFTDDSILTFATAQSLLDSKNKEDFEDNLIKNYKLFVKLYPDASYGNHFYNWAFSPQSTPYYSLGNGSAMRVSPVAYAATTLEEAEELAKISAEVTHNHPEGIAGAQAVAGAIFLARNGASKEEIRDYARRYYDQDFLGDFTIDRLRDSYLFDVTCPGSVPHAIVAFLEGKSFEDVIKTAISLGGDSDTIAAIAGSIAEAYYGVSQELKEKALDLLDDHFREIYSRFTEEYKENFPQR